MANTCVKCSLISSNKGNAHGNLKEIHYVPTRRAKIHKCRWEWGAPGTLTHTALGVCNGIGTSGKFVLPSEVEDGHARWPSNSTPSSICYGSEYTRAAGDMDQGIQKYTKYTFVQSIQSLETTQLSIAVEWVNGAVHSYGKQTMKVSIEAS